MDSIPTVIKLGDSDAVEALKEKGAAGGIPTLDFRNNSITRKLTENAGNSSTDDSSGDESANSTDEAGKARIQRNKYINEWLTDKTIDDTLHHVQLAAQANKGRSNGLTMTVGEACHNAQRGMDQAFIAGTLTTSTGAIRNDSTEYSRQVSHKVKIEAAVKAKTYLKEAKKRVKILEEEEFEKLRLLVTPDEDTFIFAREMLISIKAIAKSSIKIAKDVAKHPEGLGAVHKTQTTPRYPDLKVKFREAQTIDGVTPSAPSKEDLTDSNAGPPKYESLQQKVDPAQFVMQFPGGTDCSVPPPQPAPTAVWPQHGNTFQYPGPIMNPMHMGSEWINKQINTTETLLRNRGFPENT